MGNGKSLELFPTVITALSACETLSYGKGVKESNFFILKRKSAFDSFFLLCAIIKLGLPNVCLLCLLVTFLMYLGELSGEEYKKQLINSLCSSR